MTHPSFFFFVFLWLITQSFATSSADDLLKQADEKFEKEVAPLLIKRCIECHNPTDQSGGLDLTTAKGFRAGGESEEDLTIRDADENALLERIISGEMPPEEKGHSRELAADEKSILSRWIGRGGHWPKDRVLDLYEFTNEVRGGRDWWSFQPIQRPRVPGINGVNNPIDSFIRAKQKTKKLDFSPAASPRVIYRRLSFDTTGLPPLIEDILQFENDKDPYAYESAVDRFLASPRFGEHLGRDWLDLVRYADSNGYERDAEKPNSWKFRDWVVESINSDKPFDRFVMQQLAGDQMVPVLEENVVGTTMLRVGTWDDEPNDKLEYKYDRLEDLIHVTSTAFLGLTVKCARCHNHKFDPIPQKDYYRFGSIFWPGDLMGNKSEPVKKFDVFAWSDSNPAVEPIRLLKKGNPRQPLEQLDPGFPSVVEKLDTPFTKPGHASQDTGRRLEFAKRLVDARNPLVARVIINRVWQHYFGFGIVRTPNNFGYKGDLPTHPLLLDWLASELIANDWNLKPIHRLILTSRTYRQSSGQRPRSNGLLSHNVETADPLNFYLSRMNRKRINAESLRDTILSHSGELNLQMGGRGFIPDVSREALEGLSKQSNAWRSSVAGQQARRGIYLFVKRSLIPPLISTFDFADSTRPCGKRDLTIVAPQALALLNNQFVHQQSEAFARSIMNQSSDPRTQIQMAWQRALGRSPTASELRATHKHYQLQLAHFSNRRKQSTGPKPVRPKVPEANLVIHLDAGQKVQLDSNNRVKKWNGLSGGLFAFQADSQKSPRLVHDKKLAKPVIEFDGANQFLEFDQQVISSKSFTIVVVGHDQNSKGHREFFSNWNSNGNSTSSVFLGLTDGRAVRFSDQFRSQSAAPQHPFVLTAISNDRNARVFAGQNLIGEKSGGLTGRNLKTKFVLGTQGNYGREFLKGWIAELLVYDRDLSDLELKQLVAFLERKYPAAKTQQTASRKQPPKTPEQLALASVCHVLLNTNENIFVD